MTAHQTSAAPAAATDQHERNGQMLTTITGSEAIARAVECPYCGAKAGTVCVGLAISHIERRTAAAA